MDCSHDLNKWNEECNKLNTNDDKYINNCNLNSTCYLNKVQECVSSNLTTNANCKKNCTYNSEKCIIAIFNYCNSLDLNALKTDTICTNIKSNMIKYKCINNSANFSNDVCKEYCTNNLNECKSVSNKYCFDNINKQECQTYCFKKSK